MRGSASLAPGPGPCARPTALIGLDFIGAVWPQDIGFQNRRASFDMKMAPRSEPFSSSPGDPWVRRVFRLCAEEFLMKFLEI